MTPTPEQLNIVSALTKTRQHLLINAYAGTGKTATLKLVELAADEIDLRPVLYLVFNKANAEKAEFKPKARDDDKARRMLGSTTVRTLNSFGHRIWMKTCASKVTLDAKKVQGLLSETIKELPKSYQKEASNVYWEVVQGVALAKAIGYVPERYFPNAKRLASADQLYSRLDEEPSPTCRELIDEILVASIKQSYKGLLDFNDQVYMPALFGGSYPRFPLVMVDEYQDLNPCNHAMLDKLFPHSRVVGVGDPWQSIYAFRGAQQGGMALAKAKNEMTELPLSVSFRCPRAIVEAARWRVPNFKWIKDGGHVERLDELHADNIPDSGVFICRNNAPLYRLGFRLLASGRSISISGSDIGPKLIATMRKLGPESLNRNQSRDVIEQWLAERQSKQSKTAVDMAECMMIFVEHGATLGQAISYAEHLFAQRGAIRMMTGHKSKGLEFDQVYWLDPWLCGDEEQDLNLRYVIGTRSADRLYLIDSERIRYAS